MSIDVEVEIRRIEEVTKKMIQVVEDLQGSPMLEGMRDATLLVTRDAKKFAPVDTGRLRASIAPEVRFEGTAAAGVVGSNVKYAPHMELGTGVFVGRPRHWPPAAALETWARRHGFPSGFVVARAIGLRGGLKPRRYLQRALEQNKDKIIKLIGDAVGKIVGK
jgi:phage gpG-like protein